MLSLRTKKASTTNVSQPVKIKYRTNIGSDKWVVVINQARTNISDLIKYSKFS